jgi:UDP-2-acetamido-2,6-beta-L-arabino-hexul-4-ose reductase
MTPHTRGAFQRLRREQKSGGGSAFFIRTGKRREDNHFSRFQIVFGNGAGRIKTVVVATFCHNIAQGLPVQINDPDARLTLSI